MFERLFKFSSAQFAQGDIGLQAGPLVYVFGVALIVLVVGFVVVYSATRLYTSDRAKALSLGLRIPALCLLFIPLFEPVLITPDVVPDEQFVAVLVDASASMTLPDGTLGETRAADVGQVLFGEEEGLLSALDEPFQVRYYTFSNQAERADSLSDVPSEGRTTDLSAALSRVLSDFSGVPLAGVVLLTDGGDNSQGIPLNQAEELRSRDVPLHIVGVGQETFEVERELLGVTVSEGVEATTGAEIDIKVRSWGREPAPVAFELYRDGEVVFSETRRLKGEGKIDQLTFFYEPDAEGAREYTLAVSEAPGELNQANNALPALIDTRRDTLRVLYFEGHLRPEFKMIKRALEDDPVVAFASVARTGPGRLYRQGIRSPEELEGGFPQDEAALSGYHAVFFGDFEASAFSPEQLEMIERFVRVRGGGFMMLGGPSAFAEGDYMSTPIADLLPVELDPSRRSVLPPVFSDESTPPEEWGFAFNPTAAGLASPILKLASDPDSNRARWGEMPGLTSINYLGAIKPGAVVLAEKPEDDFGPSEPLLAVQRYGKGRTSGLATSSTWRWQMLLDAEDQRHERFWRQLVRWLTASAPGRVQLNLDGTQFAPQREVPFRVSVYDEAYNPLGGADVRGVLTEPSGATREITFQEELTEIGVYTAPFVPQEEGVYELAVTAEAEGEPVGQHARGFLVRPSQQEFYDATLKRAFLENLADVSGGAYYPPAQAAAIPDRLRSRQTSTSIYHAAYLWDVPLLFGLVLVLLSAEWIWRRRKGLP